MIAFKINFWNIYGVFICRGSITQLFEKWVNEIELIEWVSWISEMQLGRNMFWIGYIFSMLLV